MNIFLSQSGPRSQAVADALATFIKMVIPGTKCWVSSKDIDKGARFEDAIKTSLGQSTAGIVCLTSENLNARWILYEAGALSTKGVDRLWTFLLDIGHSQVEPPLSPFQHTKAPDREDVLKMIKSIYQKIPTGERVVEEPQVEDYFGKYWPTHLEPAISEQLAKGAPAAEAKPEPQVETLALVRQLVESVGNLAFRTEKVETSTSAVARLLSARGPGMGAGITRSGTLRDMVDYSSGNTVIYVPQGEMYVNPRDFAETPLTLRTSTAPTPEPTENPLKSSGT